MKTALVPSAVAGLHVCDGGRALLRLARRGISGMLAAMRVIVIGATGTVGRAVVSALEPAHEVVRASRRGPVGVDLGNPSSLDALFAAVPDPHAVICCAASGPLVSLESVTDQEFAEGLQGKLLGQVALARRAVHHLRDGGSIVLTGGTFAAPLAGGSLGALVNAGLEGFVRNAAAELPRGLRINVISPGWIRETLEHLGMDGSNGTPVADVAKAYVEAIEGGAQGQTIVP
ncbi:short chain dehydrogenase [Spirillospora sp. NPDC047279]|uniref:short chain dehydrogenase n=1 Tax=Spirillospora sp. NPDC047279 TaxID=3155478 RepID=UPI0033DBE956